MLATARMGRNNATDDRGFTLVEVTIILLVLVILSTIMLPQLGNFNRLARFVKAREDVGALCSVFKKMLDEVFQGGVWEDPDDRTSDPVGMLVGPGLIPITGGEGDGGCSNCNAVNGGIHAADWQEIVGGTFTEATDGAVDITFQVGELENHLMQNNPAGDGSTTYPNPLEDPERYALSRVTAGGYFGWRGPYLDELTPDPWGHRYAVNTFGLHSGNNNNADIYTTAVVCYSTGADGRIDTEVNQPMNVNDNYGLGWQFGRDDIGAILSAGGPF